MLFKLSFKNIRKSIKDYGIYFFTLVFAVAMFYTFNSMDAQSSMIKLTGSKKDIIQALIYVLNYISIFVSVVLGFLIVYSNNFLIKRRKKEIGLYFTLGMSKTKVSMIIVLETALVGIISLISGLLLGVGLSQLFSILTAKLFEADLSSFTFIFSKTAFNKTILYFSIIFLLVIIFNIVTLSRYKLIDLFTAGKKNEQVKIRNKYVTILSFILSCGFLGYAYYLLFDNVLVMMDYHIIVMLGCGGVGTFLLFFSLSGFLLKVIQKSKKTYYKGLNMFTLKQVNNKINTTVISTTIICLMLLLTIGALSGSMSLISVFNDELSENNLGDYTIETARNYGTVTEDGRIVNERGSNQEVFYKFNENKELDKYSKNRVLVDIYANKNVTSAKMMTKEKIDSLYKEYGDQINLNFEIPLISESDFNDLMKLYGKDTIDLKDNEYVLSSNVDLLIDAFQTYYKSAKGITVNNHKLVPATNEILEVAIRNSSTAGNDGIVIVKDKVAKELELSGYMLIGKYNKDLNYEQAEKAFFKYVNSDKGIDTAYSYTTKTDMYSSGLGMKTMLTFIGLYLGITFAITSATILAIGQLSESSDNKNRYKIVRQIGADDKFINKALFTQIAITFAFPLVVALIHSYFGLKEVNHLITMFADLDLTSNIILTTMFMVLIYGGYFLVTYLCSKNIIKEAN